MIYQTEETRQRILDTALPLLLEQGLFATQMQDIAQVVGISRTSLYRYYRDKYDLATTICIMMFRRMYEAWAAEHPDHGKLSGLRQVESFLRDFWLSPRFGTELLFLAEYDAFFSGVRVTPELVARHQRAFQDVYPDILGQALQAGMADGSIRADLDPHLASVTLANAVRGLQQRLLLRGRALVEVTDAELPRMTGELVNYLLDGLRPR